MKWQDIVVEIKTIKPYKNNINRKTVEINNANYSCCKDTHIDGLVTAIYSFMSRVEIWKNYSGRWRDLSRPSTNFQ